ncbi:hypothetical protein Y032_0340g2978 [Ancylostoma ceylanicum]|uniref:Uncharacterized protein n=1 Tax=Ancylostoma ceylanicum TaxID=53326 RepID=A0A016RYM3_9BILA|nr:hypothetical protein Y032_0340g2978 [Ancylostoma ceylanicum]
MTKTPPLEGPKYSLLGAEAGFAPGCAGSWPQQQCLVNTYWPVRSMRSKVIRLFAGKFIPANRYKPRHESRVNKQLLHIS